MQSLHLHRSLNCIALFLFISTFGFSLFFCFFGSNDFVYYFHSAQSDFQVNEYVFFTMWAIVIVTSICCLSVNIYFNNLNLQNYSFARAILAEKYKHFFWTGLLLMISSINVTYFTVKGSLVETILILGCSWGSLIAIYITYWSAFGEKTNFSSYFVYVSLEGNLSFLLSWQICLVSLQSCYFLEKEINNENVRLWTSFSIHLILSLSCIYFLSFKRDFYFTTLIILFQSGSLLKEVQKSQVMSISYGILTFLTAVTFFYYLFCVEDEKENIDYNLLRITDMTE